MSTYVYECKNCNNCIRVYDNYVDCTLTNDKLYFKDDSKGVFKVNCPNEKPLTIKFKKLEDDVIIPKYETDESAGFDIYSNESKTIEPNKAAIIKTSLSIELPKNYELQIRPRSGLSLKTNIRIANSPGTIDSDYRGEIGIIVWNCGNEDIQIGKHMRICQGVVNKIETPIFEIVEDLSVTKRGKDGFGSTGIK